MSSTQTKISMPGGGSADAYVSQPDGSGPWPGVLMFMDALGWRKAMFDIADRLAASGYCVLLPNVFWRAGAPEVYDLKELMSGGPGAAKVRALMASLTEDVSMGDAKVYFDVLAALPQVRDKNRLATTGYCMGGGFAVNAACAFPERIALAASFHGGGFVTEPGAPEKIAKSVKARVYIAVAEIDRRHDAAVTAKLEAALAKVPHQIELYAGASHGFAVADHAVYDKAAAEKHWERLTGLLRETYP